MIRRFAFLASIVGLLAFASMMEPLGAQGDGLFSSSDDARAALDTARQQQRAARARGEELEQQAARSRNAADKATQQAAALAARVQQAEAAITAAEARYALANQSRRTVDRALAERREPLVRLTAALQSLSQRPLTLAAFQPGSLRELVYTRAVLDSTIPLVRRRTAALRSDLDRARILENEARLALAERRQSEAELGQRREALVALAGAERRAARFASGVADREERRALVFAEQTRDLDALVGRLDEAGSRRERLAALPGPVPRPADPATARVASRPSPTPTATAPPAHYQLPIAGRIAYGFNEAGASGAREAGIGLVSRRGAQVVAPGAGRIVFAGPYRGYGNIVIIQHPNGWTSLVTGLASLAASVGQQVTGGSPLGLAAKTNPTVTLELRRDGAPVNPLDYLR